ncbi:MAG: hypothetical protein AAGF94_05260 [Pseudomonadota bacterium]
MTANIEILRLRGAAIPKTVALRRVPTRPSNEITDHYRQNYDDRTLIYDAVRLPKERRILLTAPRLLNLSNSVTAGLRQDGHPVRRLRHRVFPKFEFLSFSDKGGAVELRMPYGAHEIAVRPSLADRFHGLNCVKTLSQNNPLEWIKDWATFHVHHHGLEAVLFCDNGSTEYTLEDLGKTLASIRGLRQVVVLGVPYRYGPRDKPGGGLVNPMFLQLALLNLARREALANARAVLNADVDEVTLPLSGESMFDAALRAPTGAVRLAGDYAFPSSEATGPQSPRTHLWRADPPEVSTGKWCARPRGPLSRFGWHVHQVGGELGRLLRDDPRFALVHCWAAAPHRSQDTSPRTLRADPSLAQAWAAIDQSTDRAAV